MLMNRKTRPNGRMGKGNNRCSRVFVRVLAKSLLGAVKSKANRDVTIRRLPLALLLLQFQFTNLKSLPEKLEMATGIWPFQYELRISILASTGRVSSDEEVS